MSVRILAFFDSRYQSTSEVQRLIGTTDPWARLRQARPVSRQHFPLNTPSTLGEYDLADPAAAGAVVSTARQAGIDGFVVDCRWDQDRYVTGAEVLAPVCGDAFGIAFRWRNESLWKQPGHRDQWELRAERLIAAINTGHPVLVDGRPLVLVDRPKELAEPTEIIALLQAKARKAGLAGLYLVANRAEDKGRFISAGFDALVDPGPAEWHSCQPNGRPSGLDLLEVMAGLRDSVDTLDKFFPYVPFTVSRMMNRERRGKVFPRVFASFHDWATHPDGGATHLVSHGHKAIDTYFFGLFVENAMLHCHQHFSPTERLVFLESWNDWFDGSQVEPSVLDGDLVYQATRNAIERARYAVLIRGNAAELGLDPAMRERIALLCEASQGLG